jgi:hypothetical protein
MARDSYHGGGGCWHAPSFRKIKSSLGQFRREQRWSFLKRPQVSEAARGLIKARELIHKEVRIVFSNEP